MGAIAINVPDLSDSDLVFDESETKQILKFFWPNEAGIDGLSVTKNVRRFAQTILIAAIDASYALGKVGKLMDFVGGPATGLGSLATKLAFGQVKAWFKHAGSKDLKNPRVAQSVRNTVAQQYRKNLNAFLSGIESRFIPGPVYFIAYGADTIAWG